MKIGAGIERIDEALIAGKLRQNAQLDLRIVGDHQLSSCGMTAKAATVFRRVRHLLNVWVRTGESSGRRADLTKVSMQTAGRRIDELDHVLTVTGQRLLHRAVFKQRCDNRILGRQRLQFPVARRIGNGNAEPFQRLGQLLMRIEIDVVALRPAKERTLRRLLRQHFLQLVRRARSVSFRQSPTARASDPCACRSRSAPYRPPASRIQIRAARIASANRDFNRSINFSRSGISTAASRAAYSSCASESSKFQLLSRSVLSTDSFR